MQLLLAALLAAATGTAPAETPEPGPPPKRSFLKDVGVAASGTVAIALLKPDIRRALFRDARLSNIAENFAHPVRQVRRGTERDTDPFWLNNVAHPGLFALEAVYLKHRGYSDGTAFLFTQVHSVVWELVVEGSAFEPSGKDLLADAAGAAAAIWVFRPLFGPRKAVVVRPLLGRDVKGLELAASF